MKPSKKTLLHPHRTKSVISPKIGFLFFTLSLFLIVCAPRAIHAAVLESSDGLGGEEFGISVSQSGGNALIGEYKGDNGLVNTSQEGAADLFRNFAAATGTIHQDAKLTASDTETNDAFGWSVSLGGNMAMVGALSDRDPSVFIRQGSVYVFRDLHLANGTVTESAKLLASDGGEVDHFGRSVSLSGNTGLIGSPFHNTATNNDRGAAYLFYGLNLATGKVNEDVKMIASDGAANDRFGISVSLGGSMGLIGAEQDSIGTNTYQGSAYLFRGLTTATGTINESVKLVASDGAANDYFGSEVSLLGNVGLVGAGSAQVGANNDQGSAYLFRNLDTATGTISENVKLLASDGAPSDSFGRSVSLSGNVGLVGAFRDDIGAGDLNEGSAYLFRNLDAASGTVTESVKLLASDGGASDWFGLSVSLDGDKFLIGAIKGDGLVVGSGKAYSGSVSSITTLDVGNTSKTISGVSFISQDEWIIGETTDGNQVTLSAGDNAGVTASGKAVYIGKEAGSDNNTLIINGSLIADTIMVGAAGNSGNELIVGETGSVTGSILFAGPSTLGGDGTITGNLTLSAGSKIVFSLTDTLMVSGTVALDSTFGIDDLIGLNSDVANGTYTLIDGTTTDFSTLGLENWGFQNAFDLGAGKSAYFMQGSLQVQVVPEPSSSALLFFGAASLLLALRVRPIGWVKRSASALNF